MVAGRCVPGRFCLVQLHIQKDQNELYLSRSAQTELSLAGSLAGSSTSRGIGDSQHVLSFAATVTYAYGLWVSKCWIVQAEAAAICILQ